VAFSHSHFFNELPVFERVGLCAKRKFEFISAIASYQAWRRDRQKPPLKAME
jgi:hypothetical protein